MARDNACVYSIWKVMSIITVITGRQKAVRYLQSHSNGGWGGDFFLHQHIFLDLHIEN